MQTSEKQPFDGFTDVLGERLVREQVVSRDRRRFGLPTSVTVIPAFNFASARLKTLVS
jgi:hypothetical protein